MLTTTLETRECGMNAGGSRTFDPSPLGFAVSIGDSFATVEPSRRLLLALSALMEAGRERSSIAAALSDRLGNPRPCSSLMRNNMVSESGLAL